MAVHAYQLEEQERGNAGSTAAAAAAAVASCWLLQQLAECLCIRCRRASARLSRRLCIHILDCCHHPLRLLKVIGWHCSRAAWERGGREGAGEASNGRGWLDDCHPAAAATAAAGLRSRRPSTKRAAGGGGPGAGCSHLSRAGHPALQRPPPAACVRPPAGGPLRARPGRRGWGTCSVYKHVMQAVCEGKDTGAGAALSGQQDAMVRPPNGSQTLSRVSAWARHAGTPCIQQGSACLPACLPRWCQMQQISPPSVALQPAPPVPCT